MHDKTFVGPSRWKQLEAVQVELNAEGMHTVGILTWNEDGRDLLRAWFERQDGPQAAKPASDKNVSSAPAGNGIGALVAHPYGHEKKGQTYLA